MIISRTPFRISFAGGGTDLKSFWREEVGAVLSCAINKYMFISVNRCFDEALRIRHSETEIVERADELKHPLFRETLKLTGFNQGLEITSTSDIPPGTGLGSSASFTVGLLQALYAFKGEPVSPERLAREACHLEIDVVKQDFGKQDQYIAAYGGLQYIQFQPDGTVSVEPVICRDETKEALFENLLMFFTGMTRKASSILEAQENTTPHKMDFLREMRDLTVGMQDVLRDGERLDEFGELLHQGWMLKKALVDEISSSEIDGFYARARAAGAVGGKLLGAGGGGFLLLYVRQEDQERVREAIPELKEVPFGLEPEGSVFFSVA
jgi:D-glycero-alpha-D-manno-heptose-7-phosphate kinase